MNDEDKKQLADREAAHNRTAQELQDTVKALFPKGTVIECTIGRSRLRGTVTDAGGSPWFDPASIWFTNDKTGRNRRINATFKPHNLEIISRP